MRSQPPAAPIRKKHHAVRKNQHAPVELEWSDDEDNTTPASGSSSESEDEEVLSPQAAAVEQQSLMSPTLAPRDVKVPITPLTVDIDAGASGRSSRLANYTPKSAASSLEAAFLLADDGASCSSAPLPAAAAPRCGRGI